MSIDSTVATSVIRPWPPVPPQPPVVGPSARLRLFDDRNDVFITGRSLGGILDGDRSDISTAAGNVVSRYDDNGDGKISVAEATRTAFGEDGLTRRDITRLVRLADLSGNGDGAASAEEIEAMMRLYDIGSQATGIASIFDQSTAGDGVLDDSELNHFLADLGETESDFRKSIGGAISTTPVVSAGDWTKVHATSGDVEVDPRLRG